MIEKLLKINYLKLIPILGLCIAIPTFFVGLILHVNSLLPGSILVLVSSSLLIISQKK